MSTVNEMEKTNIAPYSSWTKPLLWGEGVRAALCMLPMAVSFILGNFSLMIPLGQGGFYYSSLPLPESRGKRLLVGFLLIGLGLGFYLMGGNVSTNLWLAVLFSFVVGFNLVVLVGWEVLGLVALSYVTVYSAGLNTGDPQKAHTYFFAFILSIMWGLLLSLLPTWKGQKSVVSEPPTKRTLATTGIRMGVGMAVAVAVAGVLEFSKLGWAPSGVANSVRFDWESSKIKGFLRGAGTVGGALLVIVIFLFTTNIVYLAIISYVSGVLNGLFKQTKIGAMPFFYTATILIIYSLGDISKGPELAIQRIIYNLLGVFIALFVVWYPFPIIMKKLNNAIKVE